MPGDRAPRLQHIPDAWEGLSAGKLEQLDEDHAVQRLLDGEGTFALVETHRREDGTWCTGYVAWREHRGVWKLTGHRLITEDPLHVEDSLKCRTCGHHGFIREGKWVPA